MLRELLFLRFGGRALRPAFVHHDLGLFKEVISELLQHGAERRERRRIALHPRRAIGVGFSSILLVEIRHLRRRQLGLDGQHQAVVEPFGRR